MITKENNFIIDSEEDMFIVKSIPKFKDIKNDLKNPSGKFDKSQLDLFKLYENMSDICEVNRGMVLTGRVIGIDNKQVVMDVGNKDSIIIERKGNEESICKQLQLNQNIDVMVTEVSEFPFMIKGSLSELVKLKIDDKMTSYYNDGVHFEAYVKELIPAGYVLDIPIDGIKVEAFMPNTLADVNKLYDPNVILHTTITVMLETLQKDKQVYVVSRKKYLETLIAEKLKEISKNKKDTVYTGHVTGTMPFGVFVQFEGCLTGMIHKANIVSEWRDKIDKIESGTQIQFYVKDIIKGKNVILTQNLNDSLWDTIKKGDNIKGEIISIKSFGTLVKLDYETNGLIKKTDFVKNNKNYSVGDVVEVSVVNVYKNDRKLYLEFANQVKQTTDTTETDLKKLKDKYTE